MKHESGTGSRCKWAGDTNKGKKGCERDIRLVDNRLRVIEKKMWTIAGALTIISFVVSPVGQRFVRSLTAPPQSSIILEK